MEGKKQNIKSIMNIFRESWETMNNIKIAMYHAVWKEYWDTKNEFEEIKKIWWLNFKILWEGWKVKLKK